MAGSKTRHGRNSSRSWMRQNVWMMAAVTFVIVYSVFIIRTTMWTQTFGVQERGHESDRRIRNEQERESDVEQVNVLKSENEQVEGEDQAEMEVNDGEYGEGEQKEEEGLATTSMATERPMEANGTQSTVINATVIKSNNDSEHLWTRVDDLPIAREANVSNTTSSASISNHTMSLLSLEDLPSVFTSSRFDKSRLFSKTAEDTNLSIPFEKRHTIIYGYNATLAYLEQYQKPADSDEELFLFFTCSDDKGGQDDWTPNCVYAREKVYATFATSRSTNRLLTIYTGPREYWLGDNAFTDDEDLRLKAIPTIMRWDGGTPNSLRSTWGVLIDQSVLQEPLLRYLFRSIEEQDKLLGNPEVETKEIIRMKGYAQYRKRMETYAREGLEFPLFLMISSGRSAHNQRLWCPWSRQSEMSVEYAFYAYAPRNAKLVIVETYDTYSEWRNPLNEFRTDSQLAIKGVPWFYRIYPDVAGKLLRYERILRKKFYLLENLQVGFEDK